MMTNAMRMAFWLHDGEWNDPTYNAGIDSPIDGCMAMVQTATEIKDPVFVSPTVDDVKQPEPLIAVEHERELDVGERQAQTNRCVPCHL